MFDSCSAYQSSRPHLLFLSHCVPNPPDKGEKIRAFHILKQLASMYRVHLVCFARNAAEVGNAVALRNWCETIYAEQLPPKRALCRGVFRFALGGSLNEAYFAARRMREHITSLAGAVSLHAGFVYTAVMMPYVPSGLPCVLDLVDVDSEKWLQYGAERWPGFLYRLEGERLRKFEMKSIKRAAFNFVTTANELGILRSFVPDAAADSVENGIDTEFFDGMDQPIGAWDGHRFVAFVGAMDYHPNIEAARWFARRVFPELLRRVPNLEFLIVGRNPVKEVRQLSEISGVHVLGTVADVRPFLASARALVAPLRLARGIQNKVLEALAMGREVFVSPEVCRTFGASLPVGVVECKSVADYVRRIEASSLQKPACNGAIRAAVQERFDWEKSVALIRRQLASLNIDMIAGMP